MTSRDLALPLWRRVLGADFERLPPAVRAMFDATGHRYASGLSSVEGGGSLLARLVARIAGFPRAGIDMPITILFQAVGNADVWHRNFAGQRFASAHSERRGLLLEKFGALTFAFELEAGTTGVRFTMRETRLLGVRLPRWISPRIAALQSQSGGLFKFDISVELPLAGRMARLVGLLNPPGCHQPIAHCPQT